MPELHQLWLQPPAYGIASVVLVDLGGALNAGDL